MLSLVRFLKTILVILKTCWQKELVPQVTGLILRQWLSAEYLWYRSKVWKYMGFLNPQFPGGNSSGQMVLLSR